MVISFKDLLFHLSKRIGVAKPQYTTRKFEDGFQGMVAIKPRQIFPLHTTLSPGKFSSRTETNEAAAKACLDWLETHHQVVVRGLHYELLEKRGANFICLLDMMVTVATENMKLKDDIKKLQVEKQLILEKWSPPKVTRSSAKKTRVD